MWLKTTLIILLMLGGTANALDNQSVSYSPHVNLDISDFMGECEDSKIQKLDIFELGKCVGNAVDPRIPNPIKIFDPISGDILAAKIALVNFLPFNSNGEFDSSLIDIGKMFNSLWNVPLLVLVTFIELIFNVIKFLIVFIIRFLFVYLFYISLGYQSIVNMLNTNTQLESKDKLQYTLIMMVAVSIIALAIGPGEIL